MALEQRLLMEQAGPTLELPVLALLTIAAAWATTCAQPTFAFQGQPDCVSLSFDGARTQLDNRCEQALLIDQSVLLEPLGGVASLLPAHTRTEIRDLSAFTIGMGGALYPVVAVLESCGPDEQPASEPKPASALVAAGVISR